MSASPPTRPSEGVPPADEKSFLEHLEDLRVALIRAAVSLVAGILIAIPLAPWIVAVLKLPLGGTGVDPDDFLRVIRIGDGFAVATRVIFWGGTILALPGILYAVAQFVFPGLTSRERRVVTGALLASALLFAVGATFGFVTTVRLALVWLLGVNDWLGVTYEFVELADYCGFILKLLLAFGLVFQLPVLLVALGELGLVRSATLRAKRRHVVVGAMVLAMVLTPPDWFTMVMMTLPLVALYEICVWILWFREGRGRAQT